MALVTLEQAKRHLNDPDPTSETEEDSDLELKLAAAEALVLAYLDTDADATWDEDTAPADVQIAVLLQLGRLWRYRGDDEDEPADAGDVALPVKAVLRMRKTPVIV